jgi:carbon monoxide dehydrogenase subunit G
MANVSTSIDIDAPIQDVWDAAVDLQRMGEWVSIHRDFPTPPPSDISAGTQFEQTLAVAGTPFLIAWTAVEVDGPHTLSWDGAGPAGTTAHTSYSLSEENGGTRFSYENNFELPGGKVGAAAAAVVSGAADREANESLARLKALVEA